MSKHTKENRQKENVVNWKENKKDNFEKKMIYLKKILLSYL